MSGIPAPTNRRAPGVRPLNNWTADADPTIFDNVSRGYWEDSKWFNEVNGKLWICMGATIGEATWVEVNSAVFTAMSGVASSEDGDAFTYVDVILGDTIVRTDGTVLQVRFANINDGDGPYTFEVENSVAGPEPLLDENGQALLPWVLAENCRYSVVYSGELAAWQVLGAGAAVQVYSYASADQATELTAGVKVTLPVFPGSVLLQARGGVPTSSTDGGVSLDVKIDGVSAFTTVITIDEGEESSVDATVQPAIDPDMRDIPDNSTVTFEVIDAGVEAAGWVYVLYVRRKQ